MQRDLTATLSALVILLVGSAAAVHAQEPRPTGIIFENVRIFNMIMKDGKVYKNLLR